MQPGQVFKPGQNSNDSSMSDDNLKPVSNTPQPADSLPTTDDTSAPAAGADDQIPASAQDPSPLSPVSNNQGGASDIKPSEATDNKGEGAPTPSEPIASPSEEIVPAAGAPAESAPADLDPADTEPSTEAEQSSSDEDRGDTTPSPAAPAAGGADIATPQDVNEELTQPDPVDTNTPNPEPATPPETPPPAGPTPANESSGNTNPDEQPPNEPDNPAQFSWEASEYIEHHHSALWYTVLGALALGFVALLVLVFKEILSGVVVLLMAASIMVYAHRKPRSLRHQVSVNGVQIGDKSYSYNEFKSFAVLPTMSIINIELDPVKRFMPRLAVILAPNQATAVINILSQHLPHEDRQPEFIDRLAHALKF